MTSANPVVTVGVPVYNGERFLAETLQSILAQTFTDFELLVSDNASTDATQDICERLAAGDSRVRYVRQPRNIGLPSNYNFVVHAARGHYFKWSSGSDLCKPELLARCVAVLDTRPDVVLAYARTRFFDSKGATRDFEDCLDIQDDDPVIRFQECDARLTYNNIFNGVMRTLTLRATTLNREYSSSDMVLMPELALHGKFVEVPEHLFYRRMESGAFYGEGNAATHRQVYPREKHGSRSRAWRQVAQLLSGIRRAPLTLAQRARACRFVARRSWWRRHDFLPLWLAPVARERAA